jgi:lipoprotein signal peptidase
MRLKIGILQTGIFNLADVAIFAGLFMLLLSNLPVKWPRAIQT